MRTKFRSLAHAFVAGTMWIYAASLVFGQQNPIQIDANGLTQTLTSGGLVNRGQIVKINSVGQVVPVLTTDTSGAIGVAATSQLNQGAGITVSLAGSPLVQIDSGGCVAGNIVSISTVTAGAGHCASTASGQQIGIALSISAPGSNFWNVQLAAAGGGSPVQGVPGPVFNIKDPKYGAVGDAKKSFAVSGVTATSTLTDATNTPWLSSDLNKQIFCVGQSGANALSVQFATISAVNSAGSISIAPSTANNNILAGTTQCTWFTQKDTTAILAAGTAAAVLGKGFSNSVGPYSGTVFCPPGGYVVDKTFFSQVNPVVGPGASFVGSGIGSCNIYISPDVTVSSNAWMMLLSQVTDVTVSDFTVDCSNSALTVAGQGFRFVNVVRPNVNRIYIKGCGTSGDNNGLFFFSGNQNLLSDHLFVDGNGNTGNVQPSLVLINGTTGAHIRAFNSSNPGPSPLVINGSCGPGNNGSRRNTLGASCLIEASTFDEGATGANITVIGSTANFSGVTAFAGNTGIISVDATSSVWMDKSVLVPFGAACAGGNIPGVVLAAGGYFYSTGNIISSCGTAGAVNGTATSLYVDAGGNTLQNCTAGTCTAITGATFTTQGFTGGIVPTTSLTHTYPQPFLTALPTSGTAQTIVAFTPATSILVKNFSITASNTPTCATPPTFQISNGTQSFTQTFASAAQISGPFTPTLTLFPGGTQVILSITTAAYTCATAPVNMNWSIEWEAANSQ